MNLFGVDVAGLDVAAFLAQARLVAALAGVLWIALVLRLRRPAVVLVGVLLANACVWFVSSWPLQRLYGLGPSADRVANLAWCTVVAAGGPPLQTAQVGPAPLRAGLGPAGGGPQRIRSRSRPRAVSLPAAAGRDRLPARALLRARARGAGRGMVSLGARGRRARRLAAHGHAVRLSLGPTACPGCSCSCSSPTTRWPSSSSRCSCGASRACADGAAGSRPACSSTCSRGRSCCTWPTSRSGWRCTPPGRCSRAARTRGARSTDVATVLGVNVLIVSPYLVMLLVGYPFLTPVAIHQLPTASRAPARDDVSAGPGLPAGRVGRGRRAPARGPRWAACGARRSWART